MLGDLRAETVHLRGADGDEIEAYQAVPLDGGPRGGVVVIHHMPGYDEATKNLVELRTVAGQFDESAQFTERFHAWVSPHLSRPAFIKRLQAQQFRLPPIPQV